MGGKDGTIRTEETRGVALFEKGSDDKERTGSLAVAVAPLDFRCFLWRMLESLDPSLAHFVVT